MKFKQNLANHLTAVWTLPLYIVSYLFIPHVLVLKTGDEEAFQIGMWVALFFFALTVLPAIIVYLSYIYSDFGKTVSFTRGEIVENTNGEEICRSIDDLEKIEHYQSPNQFNENLLVASWDGLSFYKFCFKGGDSFVLTCLSAGRLPPFPKRMKVEKVKRIIAWL